MRFVEKRVKKEIRKQVNLLPGDVIAVAVSGGKDSMVTLNLLHSILGERRDIEIRCITVDEGIDGYRPESIEIVKRFCGERGIKLEISSFSDMFGMTMDDVVPFSGDNGPCTYCGVFRRNAMNRAAREMGASYLATGLNLDDTAQSVMMNFTRGDVERLIRLGPHKKVQPGLIPRIQPLRMIPEKESLLYAIVAGIPYYDGVCPYSDEALRNQFRSVIDELETRSPGTRHSIISSYDQMLPALTANSTPADLSRCVCGEPTLGEECKACELKDILNVRMSTGIKGP
ncbi:MAG: TIGR00269 family protein [Methanomassiliicoccaceae archaeon]|nr:TIGR00269 family protein [Methanomassiliicoccaceae archaeon]